jgi:hypothetical protein
MRAIGFRAEASAVWWTIADGSADHPTLFQKGRLRIPVDYSEDEALAWVRNQVATIVGEFNPARAAIRSQETFLMRKPNPKALTSMLQRARIEGVIMEGLRAVGVEVLTGKLRAIASRMGSKSAKAYLDTDDVRGIDISEIRNASQRESILVAVSALGDAQ